MANTKNPFTTQQKGNEFPCTRMIKTVWVNELILDYVHTVSFSLGFYIVLRPQGIRKHMKTLRKWHRVHIALKRISSSVFGVHQKPFYDSIERKWIILRP